MPAAIAKDYCLTIIVFLLATFVAAVPAPPRALGAEVAGADAVGTVAWLEDYSKAQERAIAEGKMLLVYFRADEENAHRVRFERETLRDEKILQILQKFITVRLPLDADIMVAGERVRLLEDAAFAPLGGQAGLAVVDFRHPKSEHYRKLVGYLPFEKAAYYVAAYESKHSVTTLLTLPAGSLRGRMMIYAVRMHPERPASTDGQRHPVLVDACGSHCTHQAKLGRQGHHLWEDRFQEIWKATGGVAPVEICAESWPGKSLIVACLDCVDAWHHSSGHWNAVRDSHPAYGYDIRRGTNGIWYATGLFGG